MANKVTGSLIKAGVIAAACIIVVRIILEQLGSPESVNNIFGVAWLYLVFPVLFALRIAASGEPGPFKALFKALLLFGVFTRLMVMATYMMAYLLKWQAPRFSMKMGGNVGPDVGMLQGLLLVPVRNALIWIVTATVVGMIIGGAILFAKRKGTPPAQA
jgi:hypothetical protein